MPHPVPWPHRLLTLLACCLLLAVVGPVPASAQPSDAERVGRLERDVKQLKGEVRRLKRQNRDLERQTDRMRRQVEGAGAGGAALFVAAVLCALWAQNTGRSAWLWFFLGLFFNVITLIVLLVKNSGDLQRGARPNGAPC